jgi:dTDP-4-amino-4,6-dideoxygalactose transaminase
MTKLSIPAFSLSRQITKHKKSYLEALEQVLDQQAFIGGHFVAAFEKQLADYLNSNFVIGCNSGTDALWMALHALQTPPNGIILTTPFSFIASSSELARHKAHPVFIDIEESTFNINPYHVARWLEKNAYVDDGRTIHKATGYPVVGIIPVDLFGQCADYQILYEIAETWGLWIIEDAAQSLGATYGGKKAGSFGTISALSFYPTKNLGAFGDAGACVTDDPVLAAKLLQVRHHGRKANYDYEELGINSRLDAFQAALLSIRLQELDALNNRRREIAHLYAKNLAGIANIQLPMECVGTHVYHQYTVLARNDAGESIRPHLATYLADLGIQTRLFYPQSLQHIPFLRTHPTLATNCPITDMVVASCLSLPMWPEMTDDEVTAVCNGIKQFTNQTSAKTPTHNSNITP